MLARVFLGWLLIFVFCHAVFGQKSEFVRFLKDTEHASSNMRRSRISYKSIERASGTNDVYFYEGELFDDLFYCKGVKKGLENEAHSLSMDEIYERHFGSQDFSNPSVICIRNQNYTARLLAKGKSTQLSGLVVSAKGIGLDWRYVTAPIGSVEIGKRFADLAFDPHVEIKYFGNSRVPFFDNCYEVRLYASFERDGKNVFGEWGYYFDSTGECLGMATFNEDGTPSVRDTIKYDPDTRMISSLRREGLYSGTWQLIAEEFFFEVRPIDGFPKELCYLANYGLPEPSRIDDRKGWGFLPYAAVVLLLSILAYIIFISKFGSNEPRGGRTGYRNAFTLIELLVVIGIIGILTGLLLPAVQAVRESGRRTTCSNNLRQVALAVLNFESSFKRLPAGITPPTATPYRSLSWLTQILPFADQGPLWDQAREDYAYDPSPYLSHLGMRTPVSLFACPSDPDSGQAHYTHQYRLVAHTNYLGVNGTDYLKKDGLFFQDSRVRLAEIRDGQSNTLMIGERPPSPDFWYGWWYAGYGQAASGSPDMLLGARERNDGASKLEDCPPGPYRFSRGKQGQPCDTFHFWSYHSGGANFALADGSVHFLAFSADEILPALATRAGGEVHPPLEQ